MRIVTNPVMSEYVFRGFILAALVLCRLKLGGLVPRGARRRLPPR
jgi:hypothetical protein